MSETAPDRLNDFVTADAIHEGTPVVDRPPGQALRDVRPFVVFAFGSTREALAAEEALLDAGLTLRVVPLPRHRGSLCGIALRLPPDEEHRAYSELAKHGLVVAARDEIEDV